ncbi:MAG: hypothetical protein ABR955_14250, partial [Verrucomicrobiota bacterium]
MRIKVQFSTLMGLLIFVVIELFLASWRLWAAVTFLCMVLSIAGVSFFRLRRAKRQNPKDFAFVVYSNPSCYRSPRRERLKLEFPEMRDEEIKNWISEFKKIDDKIWQIAEGGGDFILGKELVVSKLQAAFPFLVDAGLKQARFLVNYNAVHEGY